jgi:hypothetical protein
VTAFIAVAGYHCFRGPCCPHRQGEVTSQHYMASQLMKPQLESINLVYEPKWPHKIFIRHSFASVLSLHHTISLLVDKNS